MNKQSLFWRRCQRALLCGFALIGFSVSAAHAERFELESALIESATSKALGGMKESGELATFFTAQKKMVYGVLNDIGITIESLPLDIRKKLDRFHTTNFEAFKMFSLGLNAQDEGKFAEAKAFFAKAVELDPNFELAGELNIAMPSTNIVGAVQLQAALAAAAQSATSSGKVQIEIDLAEAVAALQSGQTVVVGAKPDSSSNIVSASNPYTSNTADAGANYADRKVVGVRYNTTQGGTTVSVAMTNEWKLDQVAQDNAGLVRVGESGGFIANRDNANSSVASSLTLGDGSTVSWGNWQNGTGTSYTVSTANGPVASLGPQFQYMIGQATRTMPTTGTATFTPAGGFLNNVTGTIGADFLNGRVTLNNLGFDLGNLNFTNLNGNTSYSRDIGSGFFTGNYTSGSCADCAGFSPTASSFTGNFLGNNASGLMFSTILQTGSGTSSGVHAFSR